MRRPAGPDPFALLGLPARAGLTDDDVRAAWRRLAAATHPDRADGGDPDRFAAAAAAYTQLRTRSGRGEVLADLAGPPAPPAARRAPASPPGPPADHPATISAAADHAACRVASATGARGLGVRWARLIYRIRGGRPGRLVLRVVIAVAVSAGAAAVAGLQPATPALIVGALTWLACTARYDLAPPS